MATKTQNRPLYVIAREIREDWVNPNYAARRGDTARRVKAELRGMVGA